MPPQRHARLGVSGWAPPRASGGVTLDGPLAPHRDHSYRIACDVGLRHDRTAIAVCHAERVGPQGEMADPAGVAPLIPPGLPPDVAREYRQRLRSAGVDPAGEAPPTARRIVLDRLVVYAGSKAREVRLGDVEEAVVELSEAYNGAPVTLDPWQSIGLAQRLRARGVRVEEFAFTSTSVGRLAVTLHTLLRDHLFALPDDPELLEELGRVRLRESAPGVVRLDHDRSDHDDRAVVLALAALQLTTAPLAVLRPALIRSHRDPLDEWDDEWRARERRQPDDDGGPVGGVWRIGLRPEPSVMTMPL